MPASWVAASVRARLLGNRRLGTAGAAALAGAGALGPALQLLERSPYGEDIAPGMPLDAAQRQVAATVLWNMRLIAGWLPPGGSEVLQPLAAWFEIANIEERLAYLGGDDHPQPYELGRLAVAWPAVSRATTADAVRAALASSRWGDPASSDPSAILLSLRFRWAAWVAASVPEAPAWAAAAAALLACRARHFSPPAPLPARTPRVYGLPAGWQGARGPAELRAMMPRQTAWVLEGIDDPSGLWRGEVRWWARLRADSVRILIRTRYGPSVVVAAVALLAHDAWLVRAALGAAARGEAGRRVFDAVA